MCEKDYCKLVVAEWSRKGKLPTIGCRRLNIVPYSEFTLDLLLLPWQVSCVSIRHI